ncbi:MAG: bis(5'-nucleosyl)-tetraphosphatase (symmetrical) YqeK [Bacilli bacterium]
MIKKPIDFTYYKEKLREKYSENDPLQEKIEKRYFHSLGVADMNVELVQKYELSIPEDIARFTGLVHDYGKFATIEEYEAIVKEYNLDPNLLNAPFKVLHSTIGAYIAKKELEIDDENIINAIMTHTTGAAKMTPLQEITYLSDWIEINTRTDDVFSEIRKVAMYDYKKAIAMALKRTIAYLTAKNKPIEKNTIKAFNSYEKYLSNGKSKIEKVVNCIDHNLVNDIKVYDVTNYSPYYDYSVVTSADSSRQMNAVAAYLNSDFDINHVEKGEDWTLIDMGDIIVHVFRQDCREKYGLDYIYNSAPILNITEK